MLQSSSTVLYVEDDESDRFFMQLAFAGLGLESAFFTVPDGRIAIDYLSGNGPFADRAVHPIPGIMLLDLNLPVVSGFEVLEWIRKQPNYVQLPVVIFSSSSLEQDRLKARELGANEYLQKPTSGLRFAEIAAGLREKWLSTPRHSNQMYQGDFNRT